MSFLLDLIVVGIIILCVILGYKRGLIGVAFSLASFFVAVVISLILFIPISNFVIDNTNFDENIRDAIVQNFTSEDGETSDDSTEKRSLPEVMIKSAQKYAEDAKDASVEAIAGELAISSIKFLSFISIFVISKIILMFFKFFANIIAKLPILKQFNKAGGTAFGVLKGLLIVYALLGVISLAAPMFADAPIYTSMDSTLIAKIFYNHNILLDFIF